MARQFEIEKATDVKGKSYLPSNTRHMLKNSIPAGVDKIVVSEVDSDEFGINPCYEALRFTFLKGSMVEVIWEFTVGEELVSKIMESNHV